MSANLVPASEGQDSKKPLYKKVRWFLADLLAMLLWFYVIIKLFIFDIDIYMARDSSLFQAVLAIKFFIIIVVFALIWLLLGTRFVILWSSYMLLFPLIFIFYKVPSLVVRKKSWILAFALVHGLLSFGRSIKYLFVSFTAYAISTALIVFCETRAILYAAILVAAATIVISYFRRVIQVLRVSSIVPSYSSIFSEIYERGVKSNQLDEQTRTLEVCNLNEKQLQGWVANLQIFVLFNRASLFTAKRLREYQASRISVISYIFGLLLLASLTIFVFANINYGLYKVEKEAFSFSNSPAYFDFVYYSYNALLFNSVPDLVPVGTLARLAYMSETALTFFLIIIFASVWLTSATERYREVLDKVIADLEKRGQVAEDHIAAEFKLEGIHAAIETLERLQGDLLKIIFYLGKGIEQ